MDISGLGVTDQHQGAPVHVPNNELDLINERIDQLDNTVSCVSDLLSAVTGQHGAENMIVEIGGGVFKGEANVNMWSENHLPTSQPFGVFV
eukprot:3617937-Ditylum_brightwellii.AAC.1